MRPADALRSRTARARVLLAAGPALVTLAVVAEPGPSWAWAASSLGGLAVAIAGLVFPRHAATGRGLVLLGMGSLGAGLHETLSSRPSAVVLFALAATLLVAFLGIHPRLERHRVVAPFPAATAAQYMLGLAALAWMDLILHRPRALTLAAAGLAAAAALFGVVRWAIEQRPTRGELAVVLVPLGLGLATVPFVPSSPLTTASSATAALLAAMLLLPRADGEGESIWSRLLDHPARLLVGTFAALSAGGALALVLPSSAASGESVGLLDAAFTSVSAVCVTGLVVLDTPNAFGPVGQGILLLLIQVGGLGIMTFYPLALSLLGRRLSLRHERALAGALNLDERQRLFGSVRQIVMVTLVSELGGAAILTAAFARHGDAFGPALWRGVFTSISAFCNAGFAL
ncbi:MAG: hypothetical protein KC619_22990, partial [Myxococcales bacterium]|nr:hypothetical protein [Myxococcales bacterium]